jgi:serine protease
MTASVLRRILLPVAVLALAVVASDDPSTQPDVLGGLNRVLVKDVGLPGIDRGLRNNDPPMEPYGRGTRGLARMSSVDGRAAHDADYERGSIIVKFKNGASANERNSSMIAVDATRIERPSYANFDILEISPDADPEAVAADLAQRDDVEYAQARYRNYAMLRPNDPMYDRQWGFPMLDMERAWDIQPAAGRDVIVAVLDSGVAFRTATVRYNSTFAWTITGTGLVFPPLGIVDVPFAVAPELGDAKFVAPRDFIWNDNLPFDLDGHGTHVSGTVGQLTNNSVGVAGMAFNVRILPVKVIDDVWDFVFGRGIITPGTDDVLARAIRYAADNGAKVINLSIGRTGGGPAVVVEDAMRDAVGRGVFIAVAAGNSADMGNAPSRTAEPAERIAGVVAVAAVGRNRERAFYSTTNTYVELSAPGGDQRRDGTEGGVVQQTIDQSLLHTYLRGPQFYGPPRADTFTYDFFQGTSMATPHVAGFAALLIQQGITSPATIEAAMKAFATDLGRAGLDSEYGEGLINPRATLRGLGLAR